jgi:hypothetical protein
VWLDPPDSIWISLSDLKRLKEKVDAGAVIMW